MKKVAVIMGSDSDLPVGSKVIEELKSYGVPYEVHAYSAHRTPDEAKSFAASARENGFGVIIATAGKAAHPAGALAATAALLAVTDDRLACERKERRAEAMQRVLAKDAAVAAQ